MKALVIANYPKDLRPLKGALNHCTLATACDFALEGCEPPYLKDQGLVTGVVDKEVADQALAEPQEDNVHPLVERLMERNMLSM
ncbi:unnamed protein product [Penicillium roqueforti FM164]|uniref:Genomic scaffold, ProqFM164S01 n=1 Tax=Penicillium roqueforti (strain FM164) TaxID=1365484 RepID=W6PSR9_PENRF|nr:unnamed protein product [Penicillium roqueforti FM164]